MTNGLVQPQSADATQAVESAWDLAPRHRLGRSDSPEVGAFSAAVRLWRWLNLPAREADSSLAATASAARRHLDHDAWADAAINDAATGVDDGELADALGRVVEAAMRRRDEGERGFASGLAAVTSADAGAAAGGLAEEELRRLPGDRPEPHQVVQVVGLDDELADVDVPVLLGDVRDDDVQPIRRAPLNRRT